VEERVAGGEAHERGLLLERRRRAASKSRGGRRRSGGHERSDREAGGELVPFLCRDRLQEGAGAEGEAHRRSKGGGVLALHCACAWRKETRRKKKKSAPLSLPLFRRKMERIEKCEPK